jgi:exodeoxyribonuclease VII small subunit
MATFEEQLKALEETVEKLEQGDLSLEDSLSLFENGVTLSEACKKQLEAAEGRVQVLTEQKNGSRRAEDLDLDS